MVTVASGGVLFNTNTCFHKCSNPSRSATSMVMSSTPLSHTPPKGRGARQIMPTHDV